MKVFVSYAQIDRALVEPVVAAFRKAGLQAVESREEASCVVLFWSKAAANSEWVQEEIRKAVTDWSSGRLLLATLDDTPLPIALRDLEPVDVRGGAKALVERAKRLVSSRNGPPELTGSQRPFHRRLIPGLIVLGFLIPTAVVTEFLPRASPPGSAPEHVTPAGSSIGKTGDLSHNPSFSAPSFGGQASSARDNLAIEQEIKRLRDFLNVETKKADEAGGYSSDAKVKVENARKTLEALERWKAANEDSSKIERLISGPQHDVVFGDAENILVRWLLLFELQEIERYYLVMLSNPSWPVQEQLIERARQAKSSNSPWSLSPGDSGSPERVGSQPQAATLPQTNPDQGLLQRLRPIHYFLLAITLAALAVGSIWIWIVRSGKLSTKEQTFTTQPATLIQVTPSSDAPEVFVSYSSADGKAVEELVQQIQQFGYSVWIDRQSAGAQRYAAKIVLAIRTSKLVALMSSQNAFATGQVVREIYLAGDFQKPFIVFQLDLTDPPDEVLYFISGFPRIPVTVDREKLLSEIKRLIAA